MSEGEEDPTLPLQGGGTGAKRQGEGPPGRGKTPDHLLERSRKMRKNPTEAEARLWSRLRAGRLNGLKFRRQDPIGDYIPDFICPSRKLIVELDGSQHADQTEYDRARTAFLEGEGYRVLRFWNSDAMQRMDGVLETILAAATAPLPAGFAGCPSPLKGEG